MSWRWKTLHVMWMIKPLAHRLWPTGFTRIRTQGAEHGCGSSKKPMAKGFTKHKELCQFFFHDTWWGGYHGENGRNLWLPRLEPNLLGRLEPKSIDASMQVGIRRENGALTVESILRCHELGAEAVIDDHESRWGCVPTPLVTVFNAPCFVASDRFLGYQKLRSLITLFRQQEEKSQERSSIRCDRRS